MMTGQGQLMEGQWDELEVLQLQVLHTAPTATTAHLRKEQTAQVPEKESGGVRLVTLDLAPHSQVAHLLESLAYGKFPLGL